MKKYHFLNVLKLDWPLPLLLPLFPVYYVWSDVRTFRGGDLFHLDFSGGENCLLIYSFAMAMGLSFYSLRAGRNAVSTTSALEFFFSRAISRRALFATKTALYLFTCFAPLITVWTYSYSHPEIRLSLRYADNQRTSEEFYLTHFEGSHLQSDGHANHQVVLPNGKVDVAFFDLIWGGVCLIFCQSLGLLRLGRYRHDGWLFSLPLLPIMLDTPWFEFLLPPSPYELGLAWVSHHPILSLAGLLLLTITAQVWYCRRFVNTEILP